MNETEVPTNTSLVELLDQLVVPVPPPPISMMPQTAGWAVLGVLLVIALACAMWRVLVRYRANAYRRAALAQLAAVGDDAAQVASILRRTALAAFDRRKVAGLQGADWIAFLEQTDGAPWDGELKSLLLSAPYSGAARPAPELSARVARWIRSHDREADI